MNRDLPTGTVTFLFTDIEGSTRLAQEYPESWESLRRHHDTILRNAIEAEQGYVFRIVGDAFCAAFPAAGDALRAALKAQFDLNAKNWEGPPIKVRMGIHTGPAEIQEDGEYQGYLTLTRVQRVMSTAYGGQILLSNTAAELVRRELPEGVSLRDMREHRLKGLPQLEHLWQVDATDLAQDFPPLATLSETPNNLPVQLTSFIGREAELAAIQRELGRHRLITLTGPGGVGKTRLSIEAAADLLDTFRHGVWFVELEHVVEPTLLAATIAHVLGVQEIPGRKSIDVLKDYLRDKELLLVLDNFEQVIEAATLVKELLVAARHLKVLVTSRTPLRVAGEQEYRVPLLPLPDEEMSMSPEQLAQLGSVRLFVERAQSVKGDFALTEDNAPAIAETCQRLDGLPLAIELAAARVRVLPPQKMLSQLDNRLRFLTSAARDLPSRQQTLRAAIDWSYDLLTPAEQLFFRRLAVFTGGATFEAIDEVCNAEHRLDLLTKLESLLDKNLITHTERNGEPRYDMLQTIRDYADEALVASGEADLIQARHLLYYQSLAALAKSNIVGPHELEWFERLKDELDNIRPAVQWGLQHDLEKAVWLLCDLALFWSKGGYNDEVIGWLQTALSKPVLAQAEAGPDEHRSLRGRALFVLGVLSLQQDDPEAESVIRESIRLLRQGNEKADLAEALAFAGFLGDLEAAQESVDLARTLGERWTLSYSLAWQSQALRSAGGDLLLAQRAVAESVRLAREVGSEWAVARSVISQGQIAVALGELDEARKHLKESLTLFSQSQDRYHANLARTQLAHVERWQGNTMEALRLYKEAIVIWQDLGLQAAVARLLECLAMIASAQGKAEHAIRLLGAANRLRAQTDFPLPPNEQMEYEKIVEEVRNKLGDQLFEAGLAEGKAWTESQAVAYALALPETPAA
ncbi:MAG TPA: adenylate/guanylate cyclase domain-containing protein [Anaerolineales bacterium]|nr:adenylate/guanylate cyclase domain-containing protein [Anaerolineales bacterium]